MFSKAAGLMPLLGLAACPHRVDPADDLDAARAATPWWPVDDCREFRQCCDAIALAMGLDGPPPACVDAARRRYDDGEGCEYWLDGFVHDRRLTIGIIPQECPQVGDCG